MLPVGGTFTVDPPWGERIRRRRFDGSVVHFSQRRAFVHRDVVGLIALDFILRIIRSGVVYVSLVINICCMHRNDLAADAPGFRVPGHVIADFELSWHHGPPPDSSPSWLSASGGGEGKYPTCSLTPPESMIIYHP